MRAIPTLFVPSSLQSTEPKNGLHDFIFSDKKNINYHLLKYTVHISAYKDPIALKDIFVLCGFIARYSRGLNLPNSLKGVVLMSTVSVR